MLRLVLAWSHILSNGVRLLLGLCGRLQALLDPKFKTLNSNGSLEEWRKISNKKKCFLFFMENIE
jgi:hypothetical protein